MPQKYGLKNQGRKSALLANFISSYQKDHPKDLVFEHYLGASADAANPYALIHRLIEFIQRTTNSSLEIRRSQRADRKPAIMACHRQRVVKKE